jgi:hypothetical protein
MASASAERWNNKRRPPELVERDRRLIAASPVETVTDEDGRTWTLRRLPASLERFPLPVPPLPRAREPLVRLLT